MCVCVHKENSLEEWLGVVQRQAELSATPRLNIRRSPHMDQEAVMLLRADSPLYLNRTPDSRMFDRGVFVS